MAEYLRQYDAKIVEAVRAIVLKHVAPTRIYLFGSRATGDAKPESDYDFAFMRPMQNRLRSKKSGKNWTNCIRSTGSISPTSPRPKAVSPIGSARPAL